MNRTISIGLSNRKVESPNELGQKGRNLRTVQHLVWINSYSTQYFDTQKLISQKWLGKKIAKKYKNNLRSNNYVVCTAVARCFPNILDVMVLENINLYSDKIGRPSL
jgi:hypothetical protein